MRTALLVLACLPLASPDLAGQAPAEIRVGTKVAPPFVIKEADGSWRGIAIDLWRDVARSLERLLRSHGLEAETFASAAEFLARETVDRPSCLVLDVRLPGISGLEAQEQLTSRGLDWPVIIITGHGDVPMAVRAMKAGALDFIEKPFSDQELLDQVQRAAGRPSADPPGC